MIREYTYRHDGSKVLARFVGSLLCTLVAVGLLGCRADRGDAADEVVKHADRLYAEYLKGNCDQARRSLEETVRLIENAKLKPWGKANTLFFTYARLYVLELRSDNRAAAEAALVKARYWYLRAHELNGDSPDKVSTTVEALGAEKCMDFVDKWDRDHTGGKGPRYIQP